MSGIALALLLGVWGSTLNASLGRSVDAALLGIPVAFVAGVAALYFAAKSRASAQERNAKSLLSTWLALLVVGAVVVFGALLVAGLAALAKGFWH